MDAVTAVIMEDAWDSSADELLNQIHQWEQHIRWAYGCQVALIAAFRNRTQSGIVAEWIDSVKASGEELAQVLALVSHEGTARVSAASSMMGTFSDTHDALLSGDIDYPKAALITSELEGHSPEVMLAVEEVVLPMARTCSKAQLRTKIAKALIEVDPRDADSRHRAARTRRRVCKPRPMSDGMASIWMVLPADDAIAIDTCLNAAARSKKASGDSRTLDQLRADAITSMAHHTLGMGAIGACGSAGEGEGAGVGVDVGATHGPAESRTFVWGRTLRTASVISVTVPFDHLLDQAGLADVDWPQIRPVFEAFDVRAELDDIHEVDGAPNPSLLIPATDGRACIAPELAGYGPIPPMIAGVLALDPDSVWRRLITDPATGSLLDVGRQRYKPPAHIARHVIARDGYCIAPRCRVKAIDCDLDHTVPFMDGPTSAANLAPLCRHHHLLKTFGGWTLVQEAPGRFRWTSPTGRSELITSVVGLGG